MVNNVGYAMSINMNIEHKAHTELNNVPRIKSKTYFYPHSTFMVFLATIIKY